MPTSRPKNIEVITAISRLVTDIKAINITTININNIETQKYPPVTRFGALKKASGVVKLL